MRVFGHHHHHHQNPWEQAPPWAIELGIMVSLLIENTESLMIDLSALQAVATRLDASDTAELALLQSIKDQNTDLAAQLAALQTGDPATQATIDTVVKQLSDTADKVDASVAANPKTANLT
jgi:hypothetical protein